jgi:rhomboid family protein
MIPLTDNFTKRRFPRVTCLLCSTLVVIWICQPPLDLFSADHPGWFFKTFAISEQTMLSGQYYQLFTHMFLHGNLVHLFFNVWALWFFGSRLEQQWSGIKLLGAFFAGGVAGGVILSLSQVMTGRLGIGASAGVLGLMTIYLLARPGQSLVGVVFVVPCALSGATWFAFVVSLNLIGAMSPFQGVAFGAHLAGMFVGLVIDAFTGFSLSSTLQGARSLISESLEDEDRRLSAYLAAQFLPPHSTRPKLDSFERGNRLSTLESGPLCLHLN